MDTAFVDIGNPWLNYTTKTGRKKGVLAIDTVFEGLSLAGAEAIGSAMVSIGLDAFKLSMQMVPLDTGKTARSGRLTIAGRTIAKGTANGDQTGIDSLIGNVYDPATRNKGILAKVMKASFGTHVNVRIGFRRFDDETGESVIEKIHELGPLGVRKVRARLPGRSGQFITFPLWTVVQQNLKERILTAMAGTYGGTSHKARDLSLKN
jgi:hypothetical protein